MAHLAAARMGIFFKPNGEDRASRFSRRDNFVQRHFEGEIVNEPTGDCRRPCVLVEPKQKIILAY
jgi:hypothetical protein